MRFIRFLKAAFIFARHQAWVDQPLWEKGDAKALAQFLGSPTGCRLRAMFLNTVLRQQAHALSNTGNLLYEAGYCAGQKGLVSTITALADSDTISETEDTEAVPSTL